MRLLYRHGGIPPRRPLVSPSVEAH